MTLEFRLAELGRNCRENRGQLNAEPLHDRDDRDRDAGSDEAILNGRRARLVLQEGRYEIFHCKLHLSHAGDLFVSTQKTNGIDMGTPRHRRSVAVQHGFKSLAGQNKRAQPACREG